jgi:HPt (histidine-containing phosphotransfer) domain-containing protein
MLTPDSPKIDPLADLRARWIARSRERVANLRTIVDDLVAMGNGATNESAALESIARLAHQLAGSAGTFGYCRLSEAAATLEDHARKTSGNAATIAPSQIVPSLEILEVMIEELSPPDPIATVQ